MPYQKELQFTSNLLKAMKLDTHLLSNAKHHLTSEIDKGLRELIYAQNSNIAFLHNSLKEAQENTIYHFEDEYFCHYLFFKLPNADQYYYVGPYLITIPDNRKIELKFKSLQKSDEEIKHFQEYYASLTCIEDESTLMMIINTLGCSLWGSIDQFTNEYVHYLIPDRITPIISSQSSYTADAMRLKLIEDTYKAENYMLDAVSQGKIQKLTLATAAGFSMNIQPRLNDSIRNRKNYMIILNTLLRKAAEHGSVHPFHIDQISTSYASKIEEIKTVNESISIMNEMIHNYCLLVKTHSLSRYSYLVGQVITLVSFDLKADLSLNNLSEQLSVTPSYLSRLFKKEMNLTLTEYVNKKRIEQAVYLLNNSDSQVQSIAFECGIQDVNYFIKLFKKQTGLTPSQYRNQFVHHHEYRHS